MKRLTRYKKGYQIWKLEKDCQLKTPLTGFNYQHDYFDLDDSGKLRIKTGYAWNGCSPKVAILGMVFGTPEGTLPKQNEENPITHNLKAWSWIVSFGINLLFCLLSA